VADKNNARGKILTVFPIVPSVKHERVSRLR
jgi:hypothetical protein